MVDEKKIEQAVRQILEAIGENPDREGLTETPTRVAKMYSEIFGGMDEQPDLHKTFPSQHTDYVIEKDIAFYSMCEHHLLPFFGKAAIAYIPKDRVVGLSKLARTVETFARRPQLQEQMTAQIADAIEKELGVKGVVVITEAEHTCMTMRGVKKPGSRTVTMVTRGRFAEDKALLAEVLSLIKG